MYNFLISLLNGEIDENTVLDHEKKKWDTRREIKIKEGKGNNETLKKRNAKNRIHTHMKSMIIVKKLQYLEIYDTNAVIL